MMKIKYLIGLGGTAVFGLGLVIGNMMPSSEIQTEPQPKRGATVVADAGAKGDAGKTIAPAPSATVEVDRAAAWDTVLGAWEGPNRTPLPQADLVTTTDRRGKKVISLQYRDSDQPAHVGCTIYLGGDSYCKVRQRFSDPEERVIRGAKAILTQKGDRITIRIGTRDQSPWTFETTLVRRVKR